MLDGSWNERTTTPRYDDLVAFAGKLLRITDELMKQFDFMTLFIIYSTFTSTYISKIFKLEEMLQYFKPQLETFNPKDSSTMHLSFVH